MLTLRKQASFPDGHFYSPVVDVEEVDAHRETVWPAVLPPVLGIDFNDASHHRLLTDVFPAFISDYDYPDFLQDDDTLSGYYSENPQFGCLDSRALFVFLRSWQPRRIVEVGSGYSSLLMADVNRRFLGGSAEIACIDPFPRAFLRHGLDGIARLVEQKVQDVGYEEFERLEDGDVLFVDSSHVVKTGSDVNYLLFEILPRLRPGVRIHFHDVMLPEEYPQAWVLEENRSWNEQYMIRALLMYSTAFRVLFGSNYALRTFTGLLPAALKRPIETVFGGGSFWIEKVA